MNWSCFSYLNDLQTVVMSMLEQEPEERPPAKAILQTEFLRSRMKHIQRSFDFSIPYFVEFDPNFCRRFRSEEIEISHVFLLSRGANSPVKQQTKQKKHRVQTTTELSEMDPFNHSDLSGKRQLQRFHLLAISFYLKVLWIMLVKLEIWCFFVISSIRLFFPEYLKIDSK